MVDARLQDSRCTLDEEPLEVFLRLEGERDFTISCLGSGREMQTKQCDEELLSVDI